MITASCEGVRLDLQLRLDQAKTALERNKLGQFATPTALAHDILERAHHYLPEDAPVTFLDPAIGTGSFYSALLHVFADRKITTATGYEIDHHYGDEALKLGSNTPLQLHIDDFTQADPPLFDAERANLLICNPPYVRHHHLGSDEKQRLQQLVEQRARVRLSGLSGLYCYFLCLAHTWMQRGGIAVWLIPSEFMDVNYGRQVKEYLLSRVTLLHIHRFDPQDAQFDDALVSSAVVWVRNDPPPLDHRVRFTYGGTVSAPRLEDSVSTTNLRGISKWTRIPSIVESSIQSGEVTLFSDLFTIKRGIATGANKFFIVGPDVVATYAIPSAFLIPILPSPRYLSGDEIKADERGDPLIERPQYLLSCNLPEAAIRERYAGLWNYLQEGVAAGVHEGYICAHRSPWYAQEVRPAAPFLCPYMGRKERKSGEPFRFILNRSRATVPNVYLMLYPKPILAHALQTDPSLYDGILRALNSTTPESLIAGGRVYGGGLHKLEPNELASARLAGVTLHRAEGRIEIA
ncbi:MAG: SAM-dependent DNA methyltransferase [Chloroflexales bacterium]